MIAFVTSFSSPIIIALHAGRKRWALFYRLISTDVKCWQIFKANQVTDVNQEYKSVGKNKMK